MHRSLLKRFPLFIWLLFAVSSVHNFRPDTGGRRWSLIQAASSLALRGGTGAVFPVYTAQAPGCSIWSGPCAVCGSSPRVFHKSVACVLCLPRPSGSGSQELDGLTLPGVWHAFSPPRPQPQSPPALVGCMHPVSRHDPPGGCGPSRISGSLWLETGGLFVVQ